MKKRRARLEKENDEKNYRIGFKVKSSKPKRAVQKRELDFIISPPKLTDYN